MIHIGGANKNELLARLHAAQVQLDPLALLLFERNEFATAEKVSTVETVETSVAELGPQAGGTLGQVLERAKLVSLAICPLEPSDAEQLIRVTALNHIDARPLAA